MSGADMNGGDNSKAVAVGEVQSYLRRLANLQEQKDDLAEDIKQLFLEAKAAGYNTKMLRQMHKEARMDDEERKLFYAEEHTYRAAAFKETMDELEAEGLL